MSGRIIHWFGFPLSSHDANKHLIPKSHLLGTSESRACPLPYLTTRIPYNKGDGPPDIETLRMLTKILRAIDVDSKEVPDLLTNYILKEMSLLCLETNNVMIILFGVISAFPSGTEDGQAVPAPDLAQRNTRKKFGGKPGIQERNCGKLRIQEGSWWQRKYNKEFGGKPGYISKKFGGKLGIQERNLVASQKFGGKLGIQERSWWQAGNTRKKFGRQLEIQERKLVASGKYKKEIWWQARNARKKKWWQARNTREENGGKPEIQEKNVDHSEWEWRVLLCSSLDFN
ncbi:putative fasciculation and elongation protein zeta-2 [Apostichopus japonicus]|uniref:Putative fasciculation and elongation protein zeta-2 n=1 Tax=Stichopus japonicus TaxID=307972 RepID=A0A2G8LMP2_STIJA|nr:putative fasciculation and elongation protein zeta-2 [Apostichopus japonicus]